MQPGSNGISGERKWEFQNTIAFWAATFFLQGSVLFAIGSIAMYPSILRVCGVGEEPTVSDCQPEFLYKAWVDYSFMIGAWCFSVGNYAVYFQVINGKDSPDISYVAYPDFTDWGHIGALSNVLGSIAYNVNTMLMFDTSVHTSVWYDYNLVYVLSGGLGSALFAIGAVAEGEHNGWRECSQETLQKPAVRMAILNFSGRERPAQRLACSSSLTHSPTVLQDRCCFCWPTSWNIITLLTITR